MIINWLVTRRCNLHCELCRIAHVDLGYEMTLDDIAHRLDVIEQLTSNTTPFHIIYGGEPFIRDDIEQILELFKSKVGDRFTVYHNGTMIPKVLSIIEKVGLKRLTASVDPMPKDRHREFKSQRGIRMLDLAKKAGVEDVVATMTIDATNVQYLEPTVEMLTDHGIIANITTFDPPGGPAYDFSINDSELVHKFTVYPHMVRSTFQAIKERAESGLLLVHHPMLLDLIVESLPRNYRCKHPWKALTIDADGRIRLCLRIRGKVTPNLSEKFDVDSLVPIMLEVMKKEQNEICNGCVWTCIMMAEHNLDVTRHM